MADTPAEFIAASANSKGVLATACATGCRYCWGPASSSPRRTLAAMPNKSRVRETSGESECREGTVLSERDRRMLEEIERGLCAADAGFVQRYRTAVARTMESPRAAQAATGPNKGRVGTRTDACLRWAWQYLVVLW
jgi:hypothetical protein